jgi:hypothetical protein
MYVNNKDQDQDKFGKSNKIVEIHNTDKPPTPPSNTNNWLLFNLTVVQSDSPNWE